MKKKLGKRKISSRNGALQVGKWSIVNRKCREFYGPQSALLNVLTSGEMQDRFQQPRVDDLPLR